MVFFVLLSFDDVCRTCLCSSFSCLYYKFARRVHFVELLFLMQEHIIRFNRFIIIIIIITFVVCMMNIFI